MTEQEWLDTTDSENMMVFLQGKVSDRKLRLLACAFGYDVWARMNDDRGRKALVTAERFADGLADLSELRAAWIEARAAEEKAATWATEAALLASAEDFQGYRFPTLFLSELRKRRQGSWVDVVRCLFGNPFRSIAIDDAWLTWQEATVPKIAQSIYEERRHDELPILADALEEAGCIDAEMLDHCRESGKHIRGCWVVDLILGKQ